MFRSRYNGKRFKIEVPKSELPSRTKRSPDHVRAADINFIVARYKKTGELPVARRAGMFSDMSLPDYKDAMDLMTTAQQSFALLPARVRAAFNNDPAALLDALDHVADPKVHQRLFEAGVLASPPPEQPVTEAKPASAPKGRASGKPKPAQRDFEDEE